ncbi:MAG: NAD(P)-dependent oxidoreductase [Defluviitaleaceae bacterium]|nr:NAD(P)-dependent oxidoreductase [Defluviitaleaceae bacterium]
MINIDKKFLKLFEKNKEISIGIVGSGQMGRGLITQFLIIRGFKLRIIANRTLQKAIDILLKCGIKIDDIEVVNTICGANSAIERGKYIVTEDIEILTKVDFIDCILEATGIPEIGTFTALKSIQNKKHIVTLNVEADVVVGPYLKKLAIQNDVIYTGSAGDEPGAVMELFSFAKAIGFDVKVVGKGKNNKIEKYCNPDTVYGEAKNRKMNPKILCSFKDGTKTMCELAAMSNATGFIPDIVGVHGIKSDVNSLSSKLNLKINGGILNKFNVVEYVDGIAPGVFVIIYSENDEYNFHMEYLKMGNGPFWTLYRPYHLCNLETPISVFKAVIEKEETINSIDGLVSECIAVAKKDLKAGEYLDGVGGYTTYGSITEIEDSQKNNYVPLGLLNEKARVIKDIKKGEYLTKEKIELDKTTLIYKIRKEQDKIFLNYKK